VTGGAVSWREGQRASAVGVGFLFGIFGFLAVVTAFLAGSWS